MKNFLLAFFRAFLEFFRKLFKNFQKIFIELFPLELYQNLSLFFHTFSRKAPRKLSKAQKKLSKTQKNLKRKPKPWNDPQSNLMNFLHLQYNFKKK